MMNHQFQKLWAVCDLVMSLLFSKTTNFELRDFDTPQLSQVYFKPHPDGENFVNPNVYIPQEMVYQPPKKTGVSLLVTRKPLKATTKVSLVVYCNVFWYKVFHSDVVIFRMITLVKTLKTTQMNLPKKIQRPFQRRNQK